MNQKEFPYDDIIQLQRPEVINRKKMSLSDRAAQFAPFAALTGFDGAIHETARLTEDRKELDEDAKRILDETLEFLNHSKDMSITTEITYFLEDEKKDGGKYRSRKDTVKKIDYFSQTLILESKVKIPIGDIVKIEIIKDSTSQL
jgi:hypothetical protein